MSNIEYLISQCDTSTDLAGNWTFQPLVVSPQNVPPAWTFRLVTVSPPWTVRPWTIRPILVDVSPPGRYAP